MLVRRQCRDHNNAEIIIGEDPGSELLGHDPGWIHHLTLAEGRLGSMQNIELLPA